MKKGFTLSEVLITLVVIGVVFAIAIPVLNNVRPDKDKTTYKKGMFSIQGAMARVMDENRVRRSPKLLAGDYMFDSTFCDLVADTLGTVGNVNCSSESSYENPNFITSDGIRFWGFEGKVFSDSVKERTVHFDRKLSASEQNRLSKFRDSEHSSINTGLRVKIVYNGKIEVDNGWSYEKELAKNLH